MMMMSEENVLTAPGGPLAPTEDRSTEYRVEMAVPIGQDDGSVTEGWDDMGILKVAKRTQSATVLQRAGDLIADRVGPEEVAMSAPIRFRVWPVDEQWQGELISEPQPPILKVRVS